MWHMEYSDSVEPSSMLIIKIFFAINTDTSTMYTCDSIVSPSFDLWWGNMPVAGLMYNQNPKYHSVQPNTAVSLIPFASYNNKHPFNIPT